MKTTIFVNILLLLGAVCLFSCTNDNCNRNKYNNNNTTYANYSINHYLDTIESHIILTTVCDDIKIGSISVSILELKN